MDDGTLDNHPYGQISHMTLVDAETAYFVGYAGWGDTSVYRFNPTTGDVANEAVTDLANIDIRLIETGPEGKLWVGVAHTLPYIAIVDPANDEVVTEIQMNQNPASLVFVGAPKETAEEE